MPHTGTHSDHDDHPASANHHIIDKSIKEEDENQPTSPRIINPILVKTDSEKSNKPKKHIEFPDDDKVDFEGHERKRERRDSLGRDLHDADTRYPRFHPEIAKIPDSADDEDSSDPGPSSEARSPRIQFVNDEKDLDTHERKRERRDSTGRNLHDADTRYPREIKPSHNAKATHVTIGEKPPREIRDDFETAHETGNAQNISKSNAISFSINSSASNSPNSSDHKPFSFPPSPKKQSCSMACQVEEDELLAKTISTQTSDEDMKKMAARSRSKTFPESEEQLERLDVVEGNLLRPIPSSSQLHGILRKIPSSKWGSQSTVAFDENNMDRRVSIAESDHSRNSSVSDFGAHPDLRNSKSKGGSSTGKKFAMFQLGNSKDEDRQSMKSEDGFTPNMSKRASFAQLPADTPSSHRPRKPGMPFWKRPFASSKPMPRSFTMEDLKKDMVLTDHLIPKEELFAKLDVNPDMGLPEAEADARLVRDGKNMLTPPKKVPEIVKFMREMVGGFSPFLIIGAILCFIAYGIQCATISDPPGDNLYLAIVLLIVVLVTGGFLYQQTAKSEKIMEGFAKMLPQEAMVLRSGKLRKIAADDVVTGDIVEVGSGDRVPADVRVLESKSLKVDNSSLTGESEPQSRSPEGVENPLESKNLLFYTTNVVEGWGRGIVIKRGDDTVMGRIAKLTTRIGTSETTIAREMRYFIILICILALGMGGTIFIIALIVGYGGFYAIILAIGLVVANVPEGVVVTVTVMLTLTAQRMAKKNCLVKNLEAVETLGACSVICSDKTGTLTQNRMTVAHGWVDEGIFATDTTTEHLAGSNVPDTPAAKDLIRIATLCNRAVWKEGQEEKPVYARECKGDASETALLKFTHLVTGDALDIRKNNPAVAEIPFNSTTKFQVSVHEIDLGGRKRYLVAMKGAPERIWDRCKTIVSHGEEFATDGSYEKKFNTAYAELGGMGERVLGFCDLLLPEDKYPYPTQFDAENPNFPLEGLRFVGLIALIDPPRAAVPDGVAKCRSAGIQVIMVTGDHPVTAKAIARSVGIISADCETVEDIALRKGIDIKAVDPREANAIVIHGSDLRDMSDAEIDDILYYHAEIVFARTSPQQKLIIVEACQRLGAVVAVTGDGVNDSPALKKANIGIAMGITGSDVSKQAADMVLLDDNFASIVTGIEEGRLIFDNLKKTICYTLMANIPEITPVLLYFILEIPIGLTTIPMLLVCIGTDMVPSFSMAYESAESDIMKLPPRSQDDRLVSGALMHCSYLQAGVICAAGTFFTYFVVFGDLGFRPYDLFKLRDKFENSQIDDLQDSYGQEWTYPQRLYLSRVVQAAFFASIVVYQWADLICRRCRRVSIFQKPMKNHFLNFALLFETAVACFCIYVPGLNYALNLYTIRFVWWLPIIPFALYFAVYDEIRRYLIRRYPGGWMEREFYF